MRDVSGDDRDTEAVLCHKEMSRQSEMPGVSRDDDGHQDIEMGDVSRDDRHEAAAMEDVRMPSSAMEVHSGKGSYLSGLPYVERSKK